MRAGVKTGVDSVPHSVWSIGATLGEGPAWVAREKALWFVDIKGRNLHRFDPASGEKSSWATPDQCGFVLPISGGGFVAGLKCGLHRFDERLGTFTLMVDPEPDKPGNRLNDATVDRRGRLWFGTMDDAETAPSGAIYGAERDATPIRRSPHCTITNGPAFSPDGSLCYHVDTLGGLIYVCAVAADGALTDRRVFATVAPADGYPDGPTVDAEGCVWIGLFAGWGVRRYSPRGDLLETVRFPVANVTKLAFGGEDLKTVYATTATKGLTPQERAAQPLAGDLFSFRISTPGVAGVEASGF